MSQEKYNLSWNEFGTSAENTFRNLMNDKDFTDVTLVSCDGKQIKAHKVIISSCSPFFHQILLENPHQSPLLFLKDIRHCDLLSILNFIYIGQADINHDDLNNFGPSGTVQTVSDSRRPLF